MIGFACVDKVDATGPIYNPRYTMETGFAISASLFLGENSFPEIKLDYKNNATTQ